MGMIYKRGDIFWIKYYCAGRPIRESAGTTKKTEAQLVLKEKEGRSAAGLQPLPRVDRITYDELARDLRLHYETTGTRGLKEKAVGLSGILRHDLRRTAARNLTRSGVPEVVSMRITGHRTCSVFDRYNIVSPADLQDAARKMAGGHNSGHINNAALDSVLVSR